jgi:hypothetical protein
MDEATWFATTSFLKLCNWAEANLKSWRKRRLFSTACCRRLGDLITDQRCLMALNAAERFADGELNREQLAAVRKEVNKAVRASRASNLPHGGGWTPAEAIQMAVSSTRADVFSTGPIRVAIIVDRRKVRARDEEEAIQTDLLRDVFENPFRPVSFARSWRTSTAVSLARQMYESREFSAMPILADALQDAGCDNNEVLTHCRDPKQLHVRGCWVCDLVLERK